MRAIVVLCFALLVASCSRTVAVAVIGDDGRIMRGTATADLSGGSFVATDGELTCSGSYDSLDMSTTISMPTQCSDGRRGLVMATRDASGLSGNGRIRLEDGYEADFVFGRAAEAF